jgi:hypothetical protein
LRSLDELVRQETKHSTIEALTFKLERRVESSSTLDKDQLVEEIHLTCGTNKILLTEFINERFIINEIIVPRAPDLSRIGLQDMNQDLVSKFMVWAPGPSILSILAQILLLIAPIRQRQFPVCEEYWSTLDAEAAGPFVLRDTQVSSLDYGRRKPREIYLFSKLLMIARRKNDEIVITEKINLDDILLIGHPHHGASASTLIIYWRSGCLIATPIRCLEIDFLDTTALILWAGFLSVRTPTVFISSSVVQKDPISVNISIPTDTSQILGPMHTYNVDPPAVVSSLHATKYLSYFAHIGLTSLRQAVDVLLPLVRSITQGSSNRKDIIRVLADLGQKLSLQTHELCANDTPVVSGGKSPSKKDVS